MIFFGAGLGVWDFSDNAHMQIRMTDTASITPLNKTLVNMHGKCHFDIHSKQAFSILQYILCDNSKLFIATGSLTANNKKDDALGNFNLGEGSAVVHVGGFDTNPVYFSLNNEPAPTFNFITTEGKNKGVFELNFGVKDLGSLINAYGQQWLLTNGAIMIDGVVQSTDTLLSFDYWSKPNVMTIKLK